MYKDLAPTRLKFYNWKTKQDGHGELLGIKLLNSGNIVLVYNTYSYVIYKCTYISFLFTFIFQLKYTKNLMSHDTKVPLNIFHEEYFITGTFSQCYWGKYSKSLCLYTQHSESPRPRWPLLFTLG